MKAPANPREKRRFAGLVVLLALAGGLAALSYWPSGTPATPGLAPSERSRPGNPAAAQIDPDAIPTLRTETERGPMGKGDAARNPFRFYDPPTPTPTHTRTPTVTPIPPGDPRFVGPRELTPTPTATPIIPPAIPYKAVGLFGERDNPIVALEEGNRIITARAGDILDGRFKIERINRESVDFSFPPLPSTITRRIPLPVTAAQ
jgi:hypothetical protein